MSICLYLCLYTCLYIRLSVCLCVYLSIWVECGLVQMAHFDDSSLVEIDLHTFVLKSEPFLLLCRIIDYCHTW